jgi:hypothetical protein
MARCVEFANANYESNRHRMFMSRAVASRISRPGGASGKLYYNIRS